MADEAIAIIVAGSGKTTEKEVIDLLSDQYGYYDLEDVQLIVPVSKSLFSESVENALAWYDSDKDAIGVKVDGENTNRAGARVGAGEFEEVGSFEEIFDDSFDDFTEVEFVVAMPENPDGTPEAAWVEAALAAKREIKIRDLCAALDDVVLIDPEEKAPEPEPEPEKPKRRSRAKKTEEPEEIQHEVNEAAAKVYGRPQDLPKEVGEALEHLIYVGNYLVATDHVYAMHGLSTETNNNRPFTTKYLDALTTVRDYVYGPGSEETSKDVSGPEEAADEAPKRGRGRPRKNFEEKEIYDEDAEEWVSRPPGRLAKGTKWRVRHSETDEILDEGVQ